ncbi:hypothetical protein ScPMuIL_016257 [Solemya velum]
MDQVAASPLTNLSLFVSPLTTLPLLIATVSLAIWFSRRRLPGIPPGPPLTPILGNLPQILTNNQQQLYERLRDKFGDIFSLYIGNQLVVILNGYDLIKTAFVKNADVISDRPPGVRMIDGQTRGIVGTSGSLWKSHRKFALMTLRNFGFGKFSLEKNIHDEIGIFLNAMGEKGEANFDPKNLVNTSVSNIICSMTFGKRFQYSDPEFIALLDAFETLLHNRSGPFFNLLKFLDFLPIDIMGSKAEMKSVDEYTKFSTKIYNEHIETFDENNIRDYTDAFILEMKTGENNGVKTTFTSSQLFGEIMDLFQAGTETTSTTIRWALLYLS